MESKARLFGHPIHQMLVVFPLGLLGTSLVFDVLAYGLADTLMSVIAYHLILAGLVGGLIAAPFGSIDWLALPAGTRAKAVGALHGGGNLLVLALFAASAWWRHDDPTAPDGAALLCGAVGVGLSLVTAWLGGELVDRLGVGVSEGAHLNAPSSLRARSATPPPEKAAR